MTSTEWFHKMSRTSPGRCGSYARMALVVGAGFVTP
jgi:hypothetical protein